MNFEHIRIVREEGIANIVLTRPDKCNAMNLGMIKEISKALTAIERDDSIHVLLICGQGEHFCAGADLSHMQEMATSTLEKNQEDAQILSDLMFQLYTFPKPTIALAHGSTMGGGLGLLSASDIVLAAKEAVFAFSEVKVGITPSTISPYVIKAIGERAANYYFITASRFGAEEAMRIGLVHQIVENSALYRTGHTLAKALLANSPKAMAAAKKLIHQVTTEKISPELAKKMAEHLASMRHSPQAKEGLNAFLEKRPPVWS